jgi:hypothetical protein
MDKDDEKSSGAAKEGDNKKSSGVSWSNFSMYDASYKNYVN